MELGLNYVDVYGTGDDTDGNVASIKTKDETDNFRAGVQNTYYTQKVPAFTQMDVTWRYELKSVKTNPSSEGTCGVEIIDMGSRVITGGTISNIWPESSKSTSNRRFNTSEDLTYNKELPQWKTTISRLVTESTTDEKTTDTYTFKFDNSSKTNNTEVQMVEYVAFLSFFRHKLNDLKDTYQTGSFTAKDRKYKNTYYAYVTYDSNTGTGTMENSTNVEFTSAAPQNEKVATETTALAKNTYTKDGYTFLGWVKDSNKSGKLNDDGTLKAGQTVDYADEGAFCACDADHDCGVGPITLYAAWEKLPVERVVTYIADGGKIPADGSTYIQDAKVTNGTAVGTIPTASKAGYTFKGYSDDPVATTPNFSNEITLITTNNKYVTSDSKWALVDDLTLYAIFEKNNSVTRYTLTLDANGGTFPDNATWDNGEGKLYVIQGGEDHNNLKEYTPKKGNSQFEGWYTESSGGALVYNAQGQSIEIESYTQGTVNADGTTTPEQITYRTFNSSYWSTNGEWVPANGTTLYAHWGPLHFYEKNTDGGHPTNYVASDCTEAIMHRTLKTDRWNTVCFPFSLNETQAGLLFSDIELFTSLETDETDAKNKIAMMRFTKQTSMEAGKPYFVKVKTGVTDSNLSAYMEYDDTKTKVTTIHVKDVTLTKSAGTITYSGGNATVSMIGNFKTVSPMAAGIIYLQNDKFYISKAEYLVNDVQTKVTGNNYGYRTTFTETWNSSAGSPIKGYSLSVDLDGYENAWQEAVGIESVDDQETIPSDAVIYDLSGRLLHSIPARGMYIMNGKKYIAK